jgi:hypothetical protein
MVGTGAPLYGKGASVCNQICVVSGLDSYFQSERGLNVENARKGASRIVTVALSIVVHGEVWTLMQLRRGSVASNVAKLKRGPIHARRTV